MEDNLAKGNVNDIGLTGSAANPGSFSGDWNLDERWWRENFRDRPYVTADRRFEDYAPAYRFGYDAANRYRGRNWNDVESTLSTDWDRYEHRGNSTWDNVKDSVRDAWDNLTGKR